MSKPARLHKQEENDFNRIYNLLLSKADAWLNRHAFLCLILLGIVLMILFVALAYAVCGVSAVESGVPYRMESWI